MSGGTISTEINFLILFVVRQALYLITQGARAAAFRNVKTIAECLVCSVTFSPIPISFFFFR
jgi:hypothetical protein